ncbi:MAG: alpha/beta hydrolase, partial [Pseudobdellovibrionaceae bacterium]
MRSVNCIHFETDLFDHKFIPSKRPSSKLMIVLHGRGDSLKPFRFFDEELKVADLNYLLLNANRRYLSGFSWYGEPPFQAQGVLKSRQRLFDLLSELDRNGFSSRHIFLLGFSQGALMCSDLGMHYPKRFAGIVSVSGYFYFFSKWKAALTKDSLKTPWLLT